MISKDTLQAIKSKFDLQKFFVEELNYAAADGSIKNIISDKYKDEIKSIELIASQDDFKIIFCELNQLYKGNERAIVEQVSRFHPHNLVIFSNGKHEFHFTNLKTIKEEKRSIEYRIRPFRRIIVGPYERLRTAAERIEHLKADENDSSLIVQNKCDLAFDVEAVTREFYKDFVFFYKGFRELVQKKNKLKQLEADEFTQTIFNRFFFLYFIQKKGYLNKEPKFLLHNFLSIEKKNYYNDFVIPLFQKLSNASYKKKELENIPFLNGGLFEFSKEEKKLIIPNDAFGTILEELFEKYNFTIREDTEFEKEVAIDPEMMGTIFEQLILGLESKEFKDIPDPRKSTGSFYTPKFIVSFMIKQSLLNDLNSNIKNVSRSKLKQLVFNQKIDEISENDLTEIKKRLLQLKIVDPAVGSGAYAVGILLKIVELIERIDSSINPKEIEEPNYRYELKRQIIENCIYGVDLQHRAVNLANLRLWLSLIVDLEVDDINKIPPLPNLDYHLLCGDSLISQIAGINFDVERRAKVDAKGEKLLDNFKLKKEEYLGLSNIDEKIKCKKEIEEIKRNLLRWFFKHLIKKEEDEIAAIDSKLNLFEDDELSRQQSIDFKKPHKEKITEIELLLKQIETLSAPFNWGLDFFDVITLKGGFDIVIANPPYGVKVDDNIREEFGVENKDSYGVFTVLGLRILKPGATLCYIMSDTWQTIRTHKKLREILLKETDAQFLISVPSDVFHATVNTGVYTFIKRKDARKNISVDADNWILAADFSPLKINQDGRVDSSKLEVAFELLSEEIAGNKNCGYYTIISDRELAIYAYKQNKIVTFSNISFFIASPNIHRIMQDIDNISNEIIFQHSIPKYNININDQVFDIIKLGDLSEIKKGIDTGENDYFLFQNQSARGNYRNIEVYSEFLVNDRDLKNIFNNPLLRKKICDKGFCKNKNEKSFESERWFDGKYIVPYDKGGESDAKSGWLPNYYVPTDYYIDWSSQSVKELKKRSKRESGNNKATIRNSEYWFRQGLTFSLTGQYAPTIRFSAGGMFDNNGSIIFSSEDLILQHIALLASKVGKYIFKNFIDHTVHAHVDDFKKFPVFIDKIEHIDFLVNSIVEKQKADSRYDYVCNEQVELNNIIEKIYCLSHEDIEEIDNWYFRRYLKLANAIENKLNEKE